MPRPRKWRTVCRLPDIERFGPLGKAVPEDQVIYMTVEEYETIRLIDLIGLTQEECAAQMNVARTTVQSIYATARQKLADAIVNGKVLRIAGGDYRLCEEYENTCGNSRCHRRRGGRGNCS